MSYTLFERSKNILTANKTPVFSIIVNCYNGEKYLEQALNSIYEQSFQDWEIIFWDNASTDGSAAIAKKFDERLRYFRGSETIPLGAARKLAVEESTGEWIAFLDTDDYWHANKLLRQLEAVTGTDHVLCYAGITEISTQGKIIRDVLPAYETGEMLGKQLAQFDINMVTPIIRHETLQAHNLNFDENITASEEYNLFIRLAAKGTFCSLQETLGCYRVYEGSLTVRKIANWAKERTYSIEQLVAENPEVENKYSSELALARQRSDYYWARYLVSEGDYNAAKAVMKGIAPHGLLYKGLYLSLFVPGLWNTIHNRTLKSKLTKLLG